VPDPVKDLLVRRVLAERVKLLALIRSIVGRRDLAEDIFQELCLLVVEKRDSISPPDRLPAWLRTAARNLARNARRKTASEAILLGDDVHELLEPDWRALDEPGGLLLGHALELCLERLKDGEKEIVFGRYTDGLNYEQLAIQLQRPIGTLYTTMGRIHKKLHECIARRIKTQERHG
jgi:RNA polymerase sigma factor (sigma-70 family)